MHDEGAAARLCPGEGVAVGSGPSNPHGSPDKFLLVHIMQLRLMQIDFIWYTSITFIQYNSQAT
jgi:hypothetical protein